MSSLPVDNLERRAIEQRNQLHQTTTELRARIVATRERFDISRNLRRHLGVGAASIAAIGLLSGYAVGGLFTRR